MTDRKARALGTLVTMLCWSKKMGREISPGELLALEALADLLAASGSASPETKE